MADTQEKPLEQGVEQDAPPTSGTQAEVPQPRRLEVDDARLSTCYANFCRVTGTPEEMIIDFGLNDQPFSTTPDPIPLDHRIVMNYYTAKRLLQALSLSVQRHEHAFGSVETDVQKRVVAQAQT